MEFSNPLLHRYRSDRRKLLEFLLSSDLIKEVRTPAAPLPSISSIDFESLSVDYVLECIKSGGVLDVSQAVERYYDESSHPVTVYTQLGDTFYLHSDPDSAGSPPNRAPPPVTLSHGDFVESCISGKSSSLARERSHFSSPEKMINCDKTIIPDFNSLHNVNFMQIGLPALKTGILDDHLRESAYEVLLASVLLSGLQLLSFEGGKREKNVKFLTGLKSKKNRRQVESESPELHLKVLDTIRIQMQISEAIDTFLRRRLTQFASRNSCRKIDTAQLSLVNLTGISRTEFPSDKAYNLWKIRQANILEELVSSDHNKKIEKQVIEASLAKIRNSEEWDNKMSSSERSDVLLTIRQVALEFSSLPVRFGLEGETYYWTTGYHLNIRLYEKLLFGVFDILDDGQLIEEVEEILKLVKLTWSVLGITQRLHHILFAWVLFQQFIATEEAVLLDHAICEVERAISSEALDMEVAYMKSLVCITVVNGCEIRLSLLQSIFRSISSWCENVLHDYHLYFSQRSSFFQRLVTLGLFTGIKDPHGHNQLAGSCLPSKTISGKIRTYIEKSLDAVCKRAVDVTTVGSVNRKSHPLTILANELRLISEKDISVFGPVLRQYCPECAMVSIKTLHKFYGERLKPFLEDVTCLTEDVREVLPAAYALECCLIESYYSACKETNSKFCCKFEHYPIAEISKSIILDWVVAQHERVLEWTGRAFELEDWEPLSLQQKQAASAVEVFRIIEETVDHFFELSLPMDITHLQALISITFHSLDAYLLKVVSQLVDKKNLYPSTPPLTRYKEAKFPTVKKKVVERLILDHEMYKNLDELTISKLCIRLNTFRYIQKQIAVLEDGIRSSWKSMMSSQTQGFCTDNKEQALPYAIKYLAAVQLMSSIFNLSWIFGFWTAQKPLDTLDTAIYVNNDSVSELFVATLDCIKDAAANAIRLTSEFLGAKIVYWDLRDAFLFDLYHGGVNVNRIDGVLPQFDKILNNVCGLVDNTIRDLVVLNIWKASVEGFILVLLDGGPSRAFSDTDISMIVEDLNMFKDLFVADGEGLPRSLVEEEAKSAHEILSLFNVQTQSLIQMLMASSEHISSSLSSYRFGQRRAGDAHTLIRVLCHKRDREASKFLKRNYHLPPSSEYDETPGQDSSLSSPLLADIWKKSASFRWSEKSQSSFRSIKKRFQETTWDMKHTPW